MSEAYRSFIQGKRLYKKKEFLKAAMKLEGSKRLEPKRASIRELLAAAYYNLGLLEDSKHNFKKALDMDKSNDYAHFGLSLCLARQGDLDKALGHIKIAHAMKPGSKLYKDTLQRLKS